MSYARVKSAVEFLKEGDTLRLVVLSIDPVARRLSFSLKQAGPDPWASVRERYTTDSMIPGVVTRVVDFGAFVEIEPGLEGLIHISELSDQPLRSAANAVKPGQEVNVRVLEIDKENRRMSLSLKRATRAAQAADVPPTAAPKKKRPQLRGGLDF
jgi:ribosomal protein S1